MSPLNVFLNFGPAEQLMLAAQTNATRLHIVNDQPDGKPVPASLPFPLPRVPLGLLQHSCWVLQRE